MTKRDRRTTFKGTIFPVAVTAAVTGVGAMVWGGLPFYGSDTLGDVAPLAITQSGANLTYTALGSGQAENDILQNSSAIVKSFAGFMSRNFKQTIIDAHSTWRAKKANVLGLDAASVVAPGPAAGRIKVTNISLPQDSANAGHALPDSVLSLILAGKGAEGTAVACRHPDRLAAIDSLSNDAGGVTINHFYRRNDASGTSDTIRERVLTRTASGGGGRFCNGQAPGGAKRNTDGTYYYYTNLDAEDMDPVRRSCVAATTNLKQTKCTFWPYNVQCTSGQTSTATSPGNGVPSGVKCTQGLVVALTEPDTGKTDVTLSIAGRVATDQSGGTFGYAGREAVKQGTTTWGPPIEKISASDKNVRLNAYPLSRRLFLNHGDTAGVDSAQLAEEEILYNFATGIDMTTDQHLVPQDNRCNMAPIMKNFGFVTCYQECDNPETSLCDNEPIPAAESTVALCTAEGKSCSSGGLCCDGSTCPTSGTCPIVTALAAASRAGAGEACSSDAECTTNYVCTDVAGSSFVCLGSAGATCAHESDCVSASCAGSVCQ